MQQLQSGATLQGGKYVIERVLGQGGFGITYLANHSLLGRQVAIKEFFPKDYCERSGDTSHITLGTTNTSELVGKLKEKFLKEAINISKLNHPNIVAIHDIFEENNTAYYLMDYIDGLSMQEMIKFNGAMGEAEAIDYITTIGTALSYMHSKQMNHLDIKPANIMLRKSDLAPVLIDFGMAKQYDAAGEQTSTTPVGISHGYAPIEQYRPGGVSSFTPQTDVYALGATLYALLTGKTPPHYSDILEDGLPELPVNISKQTASAIEKAMETKKTKRPASIDEFISLLTKTTWNDIESKNSISKSKEIFDQDITKLKIGLTPKVNGAKEPNDEETVILNVPLSSKNDNKYDFTKEPEYLKIDQPQFLDLGLSVKWAVKLSGTAIPYLDYLGYKFELSDGRILAPDEFLEEGNQLPTIKHFEELLERCSWTTYSENGMHGYKIKGPNGNVLIMPLGVLNNYLTKQSLSPDRMGYCYFLYLGEYTHTLTKGVPSMANIWTVKE